MNPQQNPQQGIQGNLTPQIIQALMARRAQMSGQSASPAPAQQQVMAQNPMGGPMPGGSASPLQTSPQAVPAAPIQLSNASSGQMQPPGQPPLNGQQGSGQSGGDSNKVLMKALLNRLVAGL